ncbi:circadian-associated transcriptional repressor-like isoform X2 [Perca fluviatilis]|uniref:circadian-associated transcriptional repressor-like isoform X2 n=1 Tax=Perca fluviatilis TaxID=8168 RepID=UPI001962CFBC|nr:circadian-associated transcriptional repressor-like isoform X2 [Perca fluviatilis]
MSTSDSDYSIDWLASDEDDYDSPKRLSPQRAEEMPLPPSSTSSLRESPKTCSHSQQRRRRDYCDRKDEGRCGVAADSPAVTPVQGFTSVCEQLSVESTPPSTRKRAHSAGSDGLCEKTQPDAGNELFSQKCVELRCYIQPLSAILRGLRAGRYSEHGPKHSSHSSNNNSREQKPAGLSSFQESVATDRIQRIMGVLQNPNTGGRFLSIILKIEEMLQSWFPHIRPVLTRTDDCTPAKKQRLHASPPPSSPASLCSSDSSPHLKRLHASATCSLKTPEPPLGQRAASAPRLPARCSHSQSQEVTQDNAVSSSTDSHPGPRRRPGAGARLSRGAPPFKISSPCLERLLRAQESIVAPRTVADGGWLS